MKIVYGEAQRATICLSSLAPGAVVMDADDNYYMKLNASEFHLPMDDSDTMVVNLSTGIVRAYPAGGEYYPVQCELKVDR